jgi:hypothetical protein
MGFQGDEHDILRRRFRRIIGGQRRHAAKMRSAAEEGDALFADRLKLRPARDDRHLRIACADQARRQMAADGARSKNANLHASTSATRSGKPICPTGATPCALMVALGRQMALIRCRLAANQRGKRA